MPTLEVVMPALHNGGQRQAHECPARFRVVVAGRRWGKTLLGASECVATALQGGRAWWVAPSYKMARVGWRAIRKLAAQIPDAEIRRGDLMVRFPLTGGEVWVRSADNPDSLRGEGLDFVVLDEVGYMRESTWTEALRPALSDRRGRAMFISTPRGRNWFWRLWVRGREGDEDWAALGPYPTTANPFIDPAEVEEARRNLPERIFRQEYLAEFVDDAGGVFRRVQEAATAEQQDRPRPGREYVFGVDWGRHNDYTVIAVVDLQERALVALDRFSRVEYAHQVGRLRALYERFRPRVIVAEANAMGGPLVESLQREGLPVQAFTTTAATKQTVIDALALAFERGDIRIIPDEVLIAELQAYTATRLPSGHIRYSAPDGMHDDTVMALALAWHAVVGAEQPIVLFGV